MNLLILRRELRLRQVGHFKQLLPPKAVHHPHHKKLPLLVVVEGGDNFIAPGDKSFGIR